MAIKLTIALPLLHSLPGPYKTILMPCITLVRSTWLSLACGRSTRHATMLTQRDVRVSGRMLLMGTSAFGPVDAPPIIRDSDWGQYFES